MAFSDILKTMLRPQIGTNPFSILSKIKKPTQTKQATPIQPTINQSLPKSNFASVAGITPVATPFVAPTTFKPQVAPKINNGTVQAPIVAPSPTPTPVATPVTPVMPATTGQQDNVPVTPTKIESIPFKTGLQPEQQDGIKGLASKPVTSWSPTDLANWNYATNNAPLPEIAPTETKAEPVVNSETGQVEEPTKPVMPTIEPETQKALNEATKAYEQNLKITPEELSTQADIDKLVEATKKGFQATSEQPIPLDFITGQLKAIENRAINLVEPLEKKLARLQAARTSALTASKFGLEQAEKKATGEVEAERYKQEKKYNQSLDLQRKFESDRKFEEDKRQFGLDYALKKQASELSKIQKSNKSQSNIPVTSQITNQVIDSLSPTAKNIIELINKGGDLDILIKGTSKESQALRNEVYAGLAAQGGVPNVAVNLFKEGKEIVDDMLKTGADKAMGGWSTRLGGQLGTGYGDAMAKAQQLSAILAKDNLGLLKGAMSDKDLEFIKSMSTGFEGAGIQSEKYLKDTLTKIQTKLEKKIKESGGGEEDIVNDPLNLFK